MWCTNDHAQLVAKTVPDLKQQAPEASEEAIVNGFGTNSISDSILPITENAFISSSGHSDNDQAVTATGIKAIRLKS